MHGSLKRSPLRVVRRQPAGRVCLTCGINGDRYILFYTGDGTMANAGGNRRTVAICHTCLREFAAMVNDGQVPPEGD
jgi:hypothetical protein